MADEFDTTEEEEFDFDDEFDRLREKTARTSAVYDELEEEEDEIVVIENEGFFSRITPIQRLILALLLLVDIVVIVIGGLVVFGVI